MLRPFIMFEITFSCTSPLQVDGDVQVEGDVQVGRPSAARHLVRKIRI